MSATKDAKTIFGEAGNVPLKLRPRGMNTLAMATRTVTAKERYEKTIMQNPVPWALELSVRRRVGQRDKCSEWLMTFHISAELTGQMK